MKKLLVFIVSIFSIAIACNKEKIKTPPSLASVHTKNLAKDWKWKGNWTNRYKGVVMYDSVTTGTYNDTTMGIFVTNDSTIIFNGNSYSYLKTAGYFGNNYIQVDEENMLVYIDKIRSTTHAIVYMNYYYKTDSITHRYEVNTSGAHIAQVHYSVK